MTYFLLSITNACNKACPYCVVKPWLNSPDYPDKVYATDFIKFLEREMQEGDVVELTGGEPTLFPGLRKMLGWLQSRGARAILRTNGIGLASWRKDYPNLIVVLARHDSGDEYWKARLECLLPHDLAIDGIPEHLMQRQQDRPVFVNDETSPLRSHPFGRMLNVTNDGKVRFMACCKKDMGTVWDYKLIEYHCCEECPFALGAWNLASRIKFHNPKEKALCCH